MKLSAPLLIGMGAILLGAATGGWGATSPDIGASLSSRQVGYEIYQVRPGDTIENIASRFGVTAQSIRSVNGLAASAQVAPGQSLAVVMPSRPRIVVPKQQSAAPGNQGPGANGELGDGPLAVRYALVLQDCTILSALPPTPGHTLYECQKGTRLVVSSRQGEYLGVVMADGSTGWAPVSALELTDETISADELLRLLEGGSAEGRADIVQEAFRYLGTPYRFGGSLPQDVDCSLFVQAAFAGRGIQLPRTVAEQYEVGTVVSSSDLQPGDRLYFIDSAGRVAHTAVYIGSGKFLHASSRRGQVAVDSLSESFYRSRFCGARR
jgi:LysM repeat protein